MTVTYRLTLTPSEGFARTAVEKRGEDLVVDGIEYELHRLKDGEMLLRTDPDTGELTQLGRDLPWLQSHIERHGDVISLTVRYEHGPFAPEIRRRVFTRNMTADGALKLWEEADWGLPEDEVPPDPEPQPEPEGQTDAEGQT